MRTINEWVRYRASEQPEAVLFLYGDRKITYRDMVRKTETLAARLTRLGIGAGDRVGVMLPNHPDHITVFFALAWLGAVQVPVGIHLKSGGLQVQLEDARLSLLIADFDYREELNPALPAQARKPKVVWRQGPSRSHGPDDLDAMLAADDIACACVPAEPDRPFMISYTSGTTGRPKGAVLSERWLQVGSADQAVLCGLEADDRVLLWEPFYHAAGWLTLMAGVQTTAASVLVERFSASRFWGQVRKYGCTKIHYMGGVINILLKAREAADDSDNPVGIAWGAAGQRGAWETFERRFGLEIREGYGLTEGQNYVLMNIDGPAGSIGKPSPRFDVWIADPETGDRLPAGETGEIVLRPKEPGIVMEGYFRDPERTAQVLRNGCVYTGDLGQQDDDGYFYFAGRVKDSLRRRGENVSAWEIERVVNEHPQVELSAVIGVPSEMGEQDIKLFVKAKAGEEPDPRQLGEWLQPQLAYYQMPRFIEFVEDFPVGPTRRVQKSRLDRSVDRAFELDPARRAS